MALLPTRATLGGVSEQLTALDATFLELEEADDSAHMHIGAIFVFEPRPDGVPSLGDVRRHLVGRLGALPRYRQRLSQPRTGIVRWPSWIAHEEFDIADHVRHAALPAPGGDAELCEWAADYWSQRLDRRLPLWEMVLLEGLKDGRWALCTKTHHCLVDGVGSVDAAYLMLDLTPEGSPPPPEPAGAEPATPARGNPLTAVTRAALQVARAGLALAEHPLQTLERSRAVLELLVRDEIIAAPRTSLGVPIGTRRRYATVSAELEDLKAIKRALGGTVNDVVLTVVSSGLRALLAHRGEAPPEQGLRAMVPVNLRDPGQQLGNHVSSLFVALPVAEPDLERRYQAVRRAADALKSSSQAVAGSTVIELGGMAPPLLHAVLARSLFASRLFNVTVTNVPGPQQSLYAFGARMVDVLPLVPLAAEHSVGVAVVSYDGGVTFGVNADYETVADLDVLVTGMAESLRELYDLATSGSGADAPG